MKVCNYFVQLLNRNKIKSRMAFSYDGVKVSLGTSSDVS